MRLGGIAFRLSWLLAAFSIFAAGLASHYTYFSSRQLLHERTERYLVNTAEVLGQRLLEGVDTASRDARMLAKQAATAGVLREGSATQRGASREVMAQAFEALMAAHPDYQLIRLVRADQHGLEQVRVQRQDGVTQRATEPQLQEKGHFPYVFEALDLEEGQVYMSEWAVGREDESVAGGGNLPSFTLSSPVLSQGRVVGVVIVHVAVQNFLSSFSQRVPAGLSLYLTNRWGDWLIHPDASRTFGFDRGQRYMIQDQVPGAADFLEGHDPQRLLEVPGEDGRPMMLALHKLPVGSQSEQRFLLLGLGQAVSAVDGDATELGSSILQILLLLSVAGMVMAALVSRVVTGPLLELAQATQALSEGQPVENLPVERADEIGLLARSFRHMEQQIREQMAQLRARHNTMDHLAHHDELTGLPNRRMFEICLQQAIERCQLAGQSFAVLFVDLDHFKRVNDTLGHATGDAVLVAVARLLRQGVRSVDVVARLGGDEFIVLCEGLGSEAAVVPVVNKLQDQLRSPLHLGGSTLQVQVSIGVSLFPGDGRDPQALLASADAAMYRAKRSGRNTFTFST